MLNKVARTRARKLAAGMIAVGGLLVAVGFQNCGKVGMAANDFASAGGSSSQSSSSGGGGNLPQISIASVPMQTSNLGVQTVIPVDITVPSSYSGTLKLSVQTPELSKVDPGQGIKFSFDQPTIALTGQTSAHAKLTLNVTSMAPSFDLSMFHIHAVDMANSQIVADTSVPLSVKAVFEVKLNGPQNAGQASPENWSIAIGSVTGFISHPEGLTVTFINMDKTAHRVHSSGGPIPHEPSDMAASADGVNPGGNYTNVVAASATKSTSQVYCHDHEGGGQVRTLQFNLPVVPVAPVGASGNPNASFAYLNTNVFQPKCVSCHSAANASGGVNLSSYTNVLGFVTKGDPSVSTVYNAVAGATPDMPLNAPALSPALVQDLSDWISDGAANN